MAATETAYRVLDLEEAALAAGEDDRRRVQLRRDLDIAAFGVSAIYQAKAGEPVIGKHDEVSPFADGHEELYVVIKGGCTFSVEGDEIDAHAGTAVFVRDPAATRSSVATEDGTIVLAVGGRRGEAYSPPPTMPRPASARPTATRTTRARSRSCLARSRSTPATRGSPTTSRAWRRSSAERRRRWLTSRRRWPGSRSRSWQRATTTSPRSAIGRSSRSCWREAPAGSRGRAARPGHSL